MKVISYDTEASYAADRDIKSLGVANYVRHPDTDHFLVTGYGENHASAADPREFQWDAGAMWISHNAQYDTQVIAEYRRRGIAVPEPKEWNCSADMAAYLQSPRSLLDASRELLGIELNKSVRDEMKGKDFRTLSKEDQARWVQYGLLDAKASFLLWQQHAHKFPEHERTVSRHTAKMCARGIGVDLDRVAKGIELLKQAKWEAEQKIPWSSELTAKGKEVPITSPKAMAAECRRVGIEPPTTTEAKSEIFAAWLEENAAKAGFVQAMQEWRRANRLLTVLEAMKARAVEGRLRYSLKFFGAVHTGRWSGDAGLNVQNLPSQTLCGVDARACLVPGPGKVFIVADLSQIEPRVLHWLTDNEPLLEMLRNGHPIYEAYSRGALGWAGGRLKDEDPQLYKRAKVEVLGLGYGAGAAQARIMAKTMGGLTISDAEAKRMVDSFRRANRKVVALWDKLDRAVRGSRGGTFDLELPSGRAIKYMDIAASGRELTGRVELGGFRKRLWGSLLTENTCQSVARDIFSGMVLNLEAAGLPVVLHCHDEAVVEVDADSAEEAKAEVLRIMSTAPEWAPGLPVAAEAKIMQEYGK